MRRTTAARSRPRRTARRTAVGLACLTAAVAGTLLSPSATSSVGAFLDGPGGAAAGADGQVTVDDGVLPAGVTVFDDAYPGVARLDPELLRALRAAAREAADDGVEFSVTSGWRSAEYQDQLLREAVAEYGSVEAAARWVATRERSAHVSGDAVDIGPFAATAWLSVHGDEYGLCQIYANEPWHHELRPEAVERGCPPMYADPTHDPRMQR